MDYSYWSRWRPCSRLPSLPWPNIVAWCFKAINIKQLHVYWTVCRKHLQNFNYSSQQHWRITSCLLWLNSCCSSLKARSSSFSYFNTDIDLDLSLRAFLQWWCSNHSVCVRSRWWSFDLILDSNHNCLEHIHIYRLNNWHTIQIQSCSSQLNWPRRILKHCWLLCCC